MGYHKREIRKGFVGESSKIKEELDELLDAESDDDQVMALIELSDMVGAIQLYLEKHHPTITVEHLTKLARKTISAFREGKRT